MELSSLNAQLQKQARSSLLWRALLGHRALHARGAAPLAPWLPALNKLHAPATPPLSAGGRRPARAAADRGAQAAAAAVRPCVWAAAGACPAAQTRCNWPAASRSRLTPVSPPSPPSGVGAGSARRSAPRRRGGRASWRAACAGCARRRRSWRPSSAQLKSIWPWRVACPLLSAPCVHRAPASSAAAPLAPWRSPTCLPCPSHPPPLVQRA